MTASGIQNAAPLLFKGSGGLESDLRAYFSDFPLSLLLLFSLAEMTGEGAPESSAANEARLKRVANSAAAETTGGEGSLAGKAPFLENFLIRPHLFSQINKSNLSQYRKVYGIPASFSLRLPLRSETSKSFPNNSICVFLDSLVLGLRLPLAEPIVDLLNHTGCVPSMFSPNALPLLLATHAAFEQAGLPWSISNFFSLFSTNMAEDFISFKSRYVNKFSILGFPSSHGTWKSKYFFTMNLEGFLFDVNPSFATEDVFKAPSTMDPAIVEYLKTPRQLYTDDLLPPFLNPSGSVKAMAVPRGARAKAKATEGSGGEGGATHTPPEGSTLHAGPEVSTSQTLRQKRPNSPRAGANKAGKSTAGSSAGGSAARLTEPIVDLSEEDDEEERVEGEERGGGGGPTGYVAGGYDLPTSDTPLRWLGESGIAMVKRFHDRPTQAMGGILTTFPMQVGECIRSRQDAVLRQAWPRNQVIPRAMEQGVDAFNSLFYMCQVYEQGQRDVGELVAEKEKVVKEVEAVNNLRLAIEARANSLEVDVTRLTTLNLALCKERDQKGDEVAALKKTLEAEMAKSKEIDSLKNTIVDLRALYGKSCDALAASGKSAAATKEKMKEVEDGVEKQGKELIALQTKVKDPQSLRQLYQETNLYRVDMEHYLKEGVDMTKEYLLRDIITENMTMEECRKAIEDIDYDTVRDADLAAMDEGEDEEVEDSAEGENST